MKKKTYYMLCTWMLTGFLFMTTACEKFATEEDSQGSTKPSNGQTGTASSDNDGNACLKVSEDQLSAFSRFSFGIFHGNQKIKVVHQLQDDAQFGTLSIPLDAGDYQVVGIGYQNEKPCTISQADKITFPNNQVTPTYASYESLTIGSDKPIVLSLTPKLASSEIRLNITDEIPAQAKTIKIYYTGGSSTLDATTGYGCVNSRQTVELPMHSEQHQYSIYTLPHADGRKLKVVITVYDPSGVTMAEKTLNMIEVKQGYRSTCSLALFKDKEADDSEEFHFTFESNWQEDTQQDTNM